MGTGLAKLLRKKYRTENIILSDIIKPSKDVLDDGKAKIWIEKWLNVAKR